MRKSHKGSRLVAVTPCASMCRRQDLNLHSLDGNQALNLKPVYFSFRATTGTFRKHRGKTTRCDLHTWSLYCSQRVFIRAIMAEEWWKNESLGLGRPVRKTLGATVVSTKEKPHGLGGV